MCGRMKILEEWAGLSVVMNVIVICCVCAISCANWMQAGLDAKGKKDSSVVRECLAIELARAHSSIRYSTRNS